MKKKLALLLIAMIQSTHAIIIADSFDDTDIDTDIWSVFGSSGGQVAEGSGTLNYILETSAHAGIRLNENISTSSDFNLNADISFQYETISEFTIFGIIIYEINLEGARESVASFLTNHTNSIGITDYNTYTSVSGANIGDSSFTFQIDYSQNNESFTFLSLTDDEIIDSLTLSINGDSNHDVFSDWDLQEGSSFGIEIVAEALSVPIESGLIELDHFELTMIPEPSSYALYIGLGALLYCRMKRRI